MTRNRPSSPWPKPLWPITVGAMSSNASIRHVSEMSPSMANVGLRRLHCARSPRHAERLFRTSLAESSSTSSSVAEFNTACGVRFLWIDMGILQPGKGLLFQNPGASVMRQASLAWPCAASVDGCWKLQHPLGQRRKASFPTGTMNIRWHG